MLVKDLGKNQSIENFNLILPSVSVGNTGQLAVDCLIHHLKAVKIYQIWHEGVLPVIGKNPFDEISPSLGLAVEIFSASALKLVLVQIRSPILKKHETEFLSELLDFFKEKNVKQTIVLSSLFAQSRTDAQLSDKLERYIACPVTSKNFKLEFDKLNWKALEQCSVEDSSLHLSGAGFSKKIFALCGSRSMPCLILLKFCSDGDNIPDALDLIGFLNSWLQVISTEGKSNLKLKIPPSWKFLFGIPAPKEIY